MTIGTTTRNIKKCAYVFAAWNVRTLLDGDVVRPTRRTALVAAEWNSYNKDIDALCETRLAYESSFAEVVDGHAFFWKGLPPTPNVSVVLGLLFVPRC